MHRHDQLKSFHEEKMNLPNMKSDRIYTLEKEYTFASKEVFMQRVEINTPVVMR